MTIMPDGPFLRPHPLIWRAAFAVSIVYELGLIYMLCQVRFSLMIRNFVQKKSFVKRKSTISGHCGRGGGTWWQGMAAAIPIFELSSTICHILPYQYLRDLLGPAIPIFQAFYHPCSCLNDVLYGCPLMTNQLKHVMKQCPRWHLPPFCVGNQQLRRN